MSSTAMYQHRYGWRSAVGPSSDAVGDAVATEMFGQDIPTLSGEPLPAWEPTLEEKVGGLIAIAVQTFVSNVKRYLPIVHTYDVQAGQDAKGNRYAKVSLSTTDPHGVLQKAATYALQAAGTQGVSVTTQPSPLPGQVVLIFSQGATPGLTPPGL